MHKLNKVKENYEKHLKEYQFYYVDSVIGDDRKHKNMMKKKADYCIPNVKYYEGQLRTTENVIKWLEEGIKRYNENQTYLWELLSDTDKAKKMYGSIKNVKEAIISESAKRVALENLLTYLKS